MLPNVGMGEDQKKNWIRFAVVLSMRGKSCEDLSGQQPLIRLDDVRKLITWMNDSQFHHNVFFPVENDAVRRQVQASFRST